MTAPKTTGLTRRGALTAAAATIAAAKTLLPSGAFAAGPGPEIAKAKLGFIALTDASPVIIAKERGLFAKYGMPDVEVLKQASWAATRDNLVLGSGGGGIDGAHILSPLPYLMTTGQATGGKPTPMNVLTNRARGAACNSVHKPPVWSRSGWVIQNHRTSAGSSTWARADTKSLSRVLRPLSMTTGCSA